MDRNQKPIPTTSSQPGTNLSSQMSETRPLSESLAELDRLQHPISKAVASYFQLAAQPTQPMYCEPRRTESTQSVSNGSGNGFQNLPKNSRSRASLGPTPTPVTAMSPVNLENLDDSGTNPNYVDRESMNVSKTNRNRGGSVQNLPNDSKSRASFGSAPSPVTATSPVNLENLDDSGTNPNYLAQESMDVNRNRGGSVQNFPNDSRSREFLDSTPTPMTSMSPFNLADTGSNPNYVFRESMNVSNSKRSKGGSVQNMPHNSRSRASSGSTTAPMTPMSKFNLDDSGSSPNYAVHEAMNESHGKRRGSARHIPSSSLGMGIHVCEDDYLVHLQEIRKVAAEAKRLQPEEESWD